MSVVYTKVIDKDGAVESVCEAPNAHDFHVAIWSHMLEKYKLAEGTRLPTLNLRVLGRLWSRVAKIERDDGLLVAATFDRCWFPREEKLLKRLFTVMNSSPFAPTAYHVANCINHIDWRRGDRGIAFASSLASPWSCPKTDGNHAVDKSGHACRECGETIQHAIHMLDDLPCCREDEESSYAADGES